jgi:hypothetical protein
VGAIFLLFTVIAFLTALVMSVSVVLFELKEVASLSNVHINITLLLHEGKSIVDFAKLLLVEGVRELDLEDNEQVTKLVALLVIGHTKAFDSLDVIGLNNFTLLVLDSDLSAV